MSFTATDVGKTSVPDERKDLSVRTSTLEEIDIACPNCKAWWEFCTCPTKNTTRRKPEHATASS